MQRDVKVGIAIGVLLIALIAIFWWTKQSNRPPTPPEPKEFTEPALPPAVEPALPPGPVGAGQTTPGGAEGTTPPTGQAVAPMTGSATEAPAPPPPPPPVAKKTYKTQQGDSLATIAVKFYNDQNKWQPIYAANRATVGPDPNRLKVGLDLVIPDLSAAGSATPSKTGAPTASAAGQQKHVVATGETLSSIAKKYYNSDSKANIDRIYQANKAKIGTDPDNIQVGMELVIPPAH